MEQINNTPSATEEDIIINEKPNQPSEAASTEDNTNLQEN